ncbi:MAG: hypothetical protein DMG44_09705 [Acidobacteria bacterium]|nr:MAG: hypothetical protein DMG44_09705 [Acidobacteriota bacterium]
MKSRPTQFGARENTASPRRHASSLVAHPRSSTVCLENESPKKPGPSTQDCRPATSISGAPPAEPQRAATGGGERNAAESSTLATPPKPSQKCKPKFEPLISSPEAAKLLGNIHVKTLQRYARMGGLPGYQIGSHWYFRTSELDDWLQSRINSKCQPADRVDFTKEKAQ